MRKILWLFVPVAALLLNPEFTEGALYPFKFSLNEAQTLKRFNFEWFPAYHPAFRFAHEVVAFWVLALACLLLIIKHRAWTRLESLFSLTAFVLSLYAVRFIPWAALALVMCVKPFAQTSLPVWRKNWLRYTLAGLMVVLIGRNLTVGYKSSSGKRLPEWGFDPKYFPTTTLEALRQHRLPGRLYNSHDLGSSLIWHKLTPIFHHGFVTDMEFYRSEVIGAMGDPARFFELAKKYDWTMVLVDKNNGYRELHRILSPHPEWKIVAEDDAAYLIFKMGQ